MYNYEHLRWMRVIKYMRVSSKEETWKQVHSIADQDRDLEKLVERWWLIVVEEIKEDESAWTPHKRSKFSYMLKELSYKSPKRRRADGILCWHPNRLSRNAEEAGVIVQMLDDERIKHIFFYNYSFHNDTSGKEHLTIEFARAKSSSDSTSELVTRGIRSRELFGGMTSQLKFWYIKKREDLKNPRLCSLFPIPDQNTFSIVKMIFSLAMKKHSAEEIRLIIKRMFPDQKSVSQNMVDGMLRESFYYWKWVICKGKKNERVIDLNKLNAPDGTPFTAAISEHEFEQIQMYRTGRLTWTIRRKRINPLPQLVSCGTCWRKMYPNYRKIKWVGGVLHEKLGYECQTKHKFERCTQSRVKAETIFDAIETDIQLSSGRFTAKSYQKYIFALGLFLKDTAYEERVNKIKSSTLLSRNIKERSRLIENKTNLINADKYDKHSQEYYEDKISEISDEILDLQANKRNQKTKSDPRIIKFIKFLELRENLALYWKTADYEKKALLSKILFWNLEIKGDELAILRLKNPFSRGKKGGLNVFGSAWIEKPEPYFQNLWDWYQLDSNAEIGESITEIIQMFESSIELKFPISHDIASCEWT